MISVVINTYNAEKYLNEVLEYVKDFDEILLCDMESTDHTVEIARKHGCRVIFFPKGDYKIAEPARDFAIKQATHEWVLVVDADEIVTKELRDMLVSISKKNDPINGYYISRRNKFLGKYMLNSGHDFILRFFRRDVTSWPHTIHSLPDIKGETTRLPEKYHIIHLADETVHQWVTKMNEYTDCEIERKIDKHYNIGALIFRPLWRFFRSYVLMGGFLNGKRGILQAMQWSIYQQILVSKVLEKRLRENLK